MECDRNYLCWTRVNIFSPYGNLFKSVLLKEIIKIESYNRYSYQLILL